MQSTEHRGVAGASPGAGAKCPRERGHCCFVQDEAYPGLKGATPRRVWMFVNSLFGGFRLTDNVP